MNYQKLEETAMCYKCNHKAICKIVYQTNDCGIQQTKWDCSHYTEEVYTFEQVQELVKLNQQLAQEIENLKRGKEVSEVD